jgi:Tol biopolymer transport system component
MTENEPGQRDSLPTWSPDGDNIAFMSTRSAS